MGFSKYRVTCLHCKKSDTVTITDQNIIMWADNEHIVSGRKRLDNKWGWQCICGNTSILTEQEDTFITNKQHPDPLQIEQIARNLIPDNRKLFSMEAI